MVFRAMITGKVLCLLQKRLFRTGDCGMNESDEILYARFLKKRIIRT